VNSLPTTAKQNEIPTIEKKVEGPDGTVKTEKVAVKQVGKDFEASELLQQAMNRTPQELNEFLKKFPEWRPASKEVSRRIYKLSHLHINPLRRAMNWFRNSWVGTFTEALFLITVTGVSVVVIKDSFGNQLCLDAETGEIVDNPKFG